MEELNLITENIILNKRILKNFYRYLIRKKKIPILSSILRLINLILLEIKPFGVHYFLIVYFGFNVFKFNNKNNFNNN